MSRASFHTCQDQSGNYVVTIPKCNIQPTEMDIVLKKIEKIIFQHVRRHEFQDWDTDPARFVIGLGCSTISDGSTSHDKDIYGL